MNGQFKTKIWNGSTYVRTRVSYSVDAEGCVEDIQLRIEGQDWQSYREIYDMQEYEIIDQIIDDLQEKHTEGGCK